ncbi:hypothetical protein HPB52_015954 [Rhipicephalus sanguineus]|uniref:Tick transposon n=1 Tax=Rhipicephalus sanguineus TaxID=34632 RepID=A0A9D4PX13_RHISA|nr:hypothetical protein HPB52_015954 [Rhipicephalus sanguineus]
MSSSLVAVVDRPYGSSETPKTSNVAHRPVSLRSLEPLRSASFNPNEEAHSTARGLTDRAPGNALSWATRDSLLVQRDQQASLPLKKIPASTANSSLSRAQCVTLRLLQTSTYPSPAALHTMHPEWFPSQDCPLCGGHAGLEHVRWGCASTGPPFFQEEMKELIKAQGQTPQILAVQRARARATKFNLVVNEWA